MVSAGDQTLLRQNLVDLLAEWAYCSSADRTLLWRRDDNLCYALLQGGSPQKGEGVMSKVKGVIQVSNKTMLPCQ